jgi:hypothetical protein
VPAIRALLDSLRPNACRKWQSEKSGRTVRGEAGNERDEPDPPDSAAAAGPGPEAHTRVDGRSAEEFWGKDLGQGTKVEVTWHHSSALNDEPRTWSDNLPPKVG